MVSNILNRISLETKNQALELLKSEGRCVLVRPTGFGKTHIMASIIKEKHYKKVLYVYNLEQIKNQVIETIGKESKHLNFITYHKISRLNNKDEAIKQELLDYDLIIFDEMHNMGGELRKKTIDRWFSLLSNKTHILGATGTPDRMDGFDCISHFFSNITVDEYGLNDAISEGILKSPYYVYSYYNKEVVLEQLKEKHKDVLNTDDKKEQLNILMGKIINGPNLIRDSVEKVYGNNPKNSNYLKFIVFLPNVELAKQKESEIKTWFKVAYPDHNIRLTQVNYTNEHKKNIHKIKNLKRKNMTIDVLVTVNMLNEGYHADDITGVILLRETRSSLIYIQQVGRAFNVKSKHKPIIIDLVANINIHSLFNMQKIEEVDDTQIKSKNNQVTLDSKFIEVVDKTACIKDFVRKAETQINESLEQELVDNYTEKMMSIKNIQNDFGISVYRIISILRKNKVEIDKSDLSFIENAIEAEKERQMQIEFTMYQDTTNNKQQTTNNKQ